MVMLCKFRLAEDYEKHSKEALSNPEIYLSNPVNAFLLVKRFTTDWDNVLSKLIRGNASQGKSFHFCLSFF